MSEAGNGRNRNDEAGLRHYLETVADHAPLTRQEEGLLVERSRAGDRASLDRLVDANLRYVVRFARRFRNLGLSDLDLIAEGTVGLMSAVRHDVHAGDTRVIAVAARPIQRALRAATDGQTAAAPIPLPPAAETGASGGTSTRW